jgi:membrane protease YdiL (CAAX protease family)
MTTVGPEAILRAELADLRDALGAYEPGWADRIEQVLQGLDDGVRTFLMSFELWGGAGSIASLAGAPRPPEAQVRIRDALIRLGDSQTAYGLGNPGVAGWLQTLKSWREAQYRQDREGELPSVPWRPRDVWLGVAAIAVILAITYGLVFALGALSITPDVDLWVAIVPTLFELLFLVPVWWFTVRKYHVRLSALGFRSFRPSALGLVVVSLFAIFVFNALYGLLLMQFGWESQPDMTPLLRRLSSPWPLFVAVVLVAPLAEETFFRGFVFGGLRARYDWRTAAAISSALFAAVHLQLLFFIPAFVFGFVFAWLYQRSGSIWPGMILHALVNGISLAIVYSQV